MGLVEDHGGDSRAPVASNSVQGSGGSADVLPSIADALDAAGSGCSAVKPGFSKRPRTQVDEDDSLLEKLLEETEAADAKEYVPLKKRKAIREQLLKKQLQALNIHLETEEGAPGFTESDQDEESKQKEAKQKEAGKQRNNAVACKSV